MPGIPSGETPGTTRRPTAGDIFDRALHIAEEELKRSSTGLGFSAVAAGLTMGLTGFGVAAARVAVGDVGGAELIADLFYPLGFIAVIVGRQQLFTENTLFPVALVLDSRRHLRNTARLWGVVFAGNQVGALLFGLLAVTTGALDQEIVDALAELGTHAAAGGFGQLFWSGVIGGWVIALMAWAVTGSQWTIAQVAIAYVMTLPLGIGGVAHSVAGAAEIWSAVMAGEVRVGDYLRWIVPAGLGNAAGGVVIVSLLNYAQVVGAGRDRERALRSVEEVEREMWPDEDG